MKLTIHNLYDMCQEMAQRKDTTKEHMYNGVQALYVKACDVTGKKPMTSRQWERKVRRLAIKGLPTKEKASIDDLFAITTTISTFDDTDVADVMNGITSIYNLTLKKIKK